MSAVSMIKLSKDLLPIYELELALGNELDRIDEPAGSKCPYAIVFKYPLHKREIDSTLILTSHVRYGETHDSHYGLDTHYFSDESRHAVIGPLPGSHRNPRSSR